MLVPLLLAHTLFAMQQDGVLWKKVLLKSPPHCETALMFQGPTSPIEPAKIAPKKFGIDKIEWWFPWMLEGFAQTSASGYQKYFRVFAQEQKGDKPSQIAQMLLRLWDMNYRRLRLTHPLDYNGGLVEVYLCFGGKAGGEQLFDVDKGINLKTNRDVDIKVNTIYIYDMESFTDPVEMVREVAHEYGHATLPHIGGFKEPEYWADGYLGEKLYLRWLRDDLAKGDLETIDTMGATKANLDKWIAANVDPLIEKSAQILPSEYVLTDLSAAGMNKFVGLALYIDTLYGDSVFARSILMNGTEVKDYPAAAVLAVEEPDTVTLNIPPNLVGKLIWIPLGTGKLKGLPWLKHDPSGWAQIKPKSTQVVISNVH